MLDLDTLEAWRKAALELAMWKEREMTLRKVVFADAFPNPVEGTNKHEVMDGWTIKATQPYTRALDQSKVEPILKDLKKQKLGDLIKVKYELSVTDYKKLAEDDPAKAVIDAILTTKPGAPSLELIAPKGQ